VAGLWVSSATPIYATVIFTLGNVPQADEENVLLSSGLTGDPVFGTTTTSDLTVVFYSTTDVLVEPSAGQARVSSSDELLNNITISLLDGFYTDLILNPFEGSGSATLTVVTNDGTQLFVYALSNGQNFLTLLAVGGEHILSTTIDSAEGFRDLRQPRISGAAVNLASAPEPASLLLLGTGLVGASALFRKTRR